MYDIVMYMYSKTLLLLYAQKVLKILMHDIIMFITSFVITSLLFTHNQIYYVLDQTFQAYEPPHGKTNNVVSEQVRHKLACTSTEKT